MELRDHSRCGPCSLRWKAPATALTAIALLLAGCGGGPSSALLLTKPRWANLPSYKERCRRLDRLGALGRVVYESHRHMRRGSSETVTAAVTLDSSAPPDVVLQRRGSTQARGLVVSCVLQAQLSASPYQFDVDNMDWEGRSLETTDTARWSWYVTPKVGGTHTLVLRVRPIVALRDGERRATVPVDDTPASVEQYEIAVQVRVPLMERLPEFISRLSALLKVSEDFVVGLSSLLLAVGSLLTVLGIRKRRRKNPQS